MTTGESNEFQQLRNALEQSRRNTFRYPSALRAQVADYLKRQLARGEKLAPLAYGLGLAYKSALAWLDEYQKAPAFVPVTLRESAPVAATASLSLVFPNGARIDGLSLLDIAALCREVGS